MCNNNIVYIYIYGYVHIYTHMHIWTQILNKYKARSLPVLSNMMFWCFLIILLGLVTIISRIHIDTDLNEEVVCWRSTNGCTIYLFIPLEFSLMSIEFISGKKKWCKLDFLPPTILFLLNPLWPPTNQNHFVCFLFWRDSGR